MAEFHDKWPPFELPPEGATAPMFPLQDVFLFPRQVLPLHIFEPRYRQMIEDSLDGPGRLIVATALEVEVEGGPSPAVLPVAGLGEIMRHEKLPDGRFMIWLLGLGRFEIAELDSDRLYRRVRYRALAEVDVPAEEADDLNATLRLALEKHTGKQLELPDGVPPSVLTDLLMQAIQPPADMMGQMFAEIEVAERARLALEYSGYD